MIVSTPSSRALAAVLPLVATQPYEAHQKARTFASRYIKSRQYDTAIDVLFQSARELFKAGQTGSGVDLTLYLLDVYDAKEERVSEESRGRITQLIALTGSAGTWRKTIIDKAIVWSAARGSCPAGDQDLHHYVGELLYKEGAFDSAEPHLLAAGKRDSARLLAVMMAEWSTAGATPGAFALRGTLPYLLNGDIMSARTFITHYVSILPQARYHPSLQLTPVSAGSDCEMAFTSDSMLNFCQIALLTCQRAQGERNKAMRDVWVRLCGTYQSRRGLLATPEVRNVLNELGNLYFAIPSPRNQANPFGEMMSSLFGGPGAGAPTRRMLEPAGADGLD